MKRILPLLLLAAFLAPAARGETVVPTDYAWRVPIIVSGYAGTDTLTNFPVLVKLAEGAPTGFSYADCAEDGSDLRFADANGAILSHEIEAWNPSGESFVWVRVPRLAGTSTQISLYYDALGASALPAVDPADVWSRYAVVIHGGSVLTNAVGNGLAVAAGSASVAADMAAGLAGGGVAKSAYNAIGLNVANPSAKLADSGRFTVSGWFRRDGNGGKNNGTHVLMSSLTNWQANDGFLVLQETGTHISIASKAGHNWTSGHYALADRTWGHVAFAYDKIGSTLVSYFDGAQDNAKSGPGLLENASVAWWTFGSYGNHASEDSFKGEMDELRVFDGVASADWIRAEHDSVADPASFVSLGPAETTDENLPRLSASASDENGTATFAVPLAAPGFGGAVPTAVSVFYGTNGVDWTELFLGSTNAAATLAGTASGLTGNVRYLWYATAAATLDGTNRTAKTPQRSFIANTVEPTGTYMSFTATVDWAGDPVENVPVLLRLSETAINGFLYSDVTSSRFEMLDSDGHLLPYEIDTWNTDGESLVWVLLPDYRDGATFTVRYGTAFANAPVSAEKVWAGYKGVWHMDSVDPADSSPNGFDGTHKTANLSVVDGAIGSAVNVPRTSTSDGITCGEVLANSEIAAGFTVGGWCRPTQYGNVGDGAAMFGKNAFISVRIKDATHVVVTTPGVENHTMELASGVLPAVGEWWHFAVTFKMNTSGNGLNFYVNGQLVKTQTAKNISDTTSASEMFLGNNQWNQAFKGDLDEIRLAAGIRSTNEIAAEYHAMADAAALVCSAAETSDDDLPVIGAASAAGGSGSVAFSVALDRPGFGGAVPTSVSVFYGTNGVDWTELVLGSTNETATLTGTATGLRGNTVYLWYAAATATQVGVDKSADSSRMPRTVRTGALPAPEAYKTFTATVEYEGATAQNVPVLLRLSETAIDGFHYADVTASGFEIVDASGNLLPWEIDTWDETGESLLWARLPVWEDGATIVVRYGADFANSPSPASETWADYVGVWHLNDTNAASAYGSYPNSTAAVGIDGEKAQASIADETGVFGKSVKICDAAKQGEGYHLGGVFVPDSGAASPLDLGDTFVISGWFRHKNQDYYYDKFFAKRGKANNDASVPPTGAFTVEHGSNGSENKISVFGGGGTYKSVKPNSTLRDAWSYLTFVYDGSTASVYQNGALCDSGTVNPVTDNDGRLCFGNLTGGYGTGTGDCAWCGWIDEVRLADGVPSAAWIAAEYAAMADPAALSYGPATTVDAATPELSVPTVARNADGSFTVSVVVSENVPASVACLVGGSSVPMATVDAALPMTYSAVLSGLADGTHVASVRAESTTGNEAFANCPTVFHAGALAVTKRSDADEGSLTPGVFRVSRLDADATDLPALTFDVAFSGDGLAAVVAPGITTATIPAGAAYVDIALTPVVTDAVDENADIVLTVSGTNIGMPSNGTLTVVNASYDVAVRYVAMTGDDANHGGTPALPKKTVGAAVASLANVAQSQTCTVHVARGLYPITAKIVVTNAIRVVGDDPDPSKVLVSNTVGAGYYTQDQRVFQLDHADALVANLTMQNGQEYGYGGDFYVGTAGGIVSNCVVEAGYTRDNGKASGGWLDGGLVTHTIFRKNASSAGSANWDGNRPGVLQLNGSARAENCLFVGNNQYAAVTLINVYGSSVMRNCSIVDSSLAATNEACKAWSAINIGSGATVQNVVIAGVTNKVDGTPCPPTGAVANFVNGAFDGDATDLPEGMVVGTASTFFRDHAASDYAVKYRPKSGGPLYDKGSDYTPMAAFDLSGVQSRKIGAHVDIGCYEANGSSTVIIVK